MPSCAQPPVPIVVMLPFPDPLLKQPKAGKMSHIQDLLFVVNSCQCCVEQLCYPEGHVRVGQSEAFHTGEYGMVVCGEWGQG